MTRPQFRCSREERRSIFGMIPPLHDCRIGSTLSFFSIHLWFLYSRVQGLRVRTQDWGITSPRSHLHKMKAVFAVVLCLTILISVHGAPTSSIPHVEESTPVPLLRYDNCLPMGKNRYISRSSQFLPHTLRVYWSINGTHLNAALLGHSIGHSPS